MIRRLAAALLLPLLALAHGCTPDTLDPLPVGPVNGWTAVQPVPVGYDLNDVWGDAPRDVWSVGDYGVIVHWNGETLRRVDSPVTVDLTRIEGWSRTDLYAVGREVLLHYDGRTWEIQQTFPDENLTGLLCHTDGRLYLTGTRGLMVRSKGEWSVIDGPSRQASAVWDDGEGGIRVGDGPVLWRILDGEIAREHEFHPESNIVAGDNRCLLRESGGDRRASRYVTDIGWFQAVETWNSIRAIVDMGELVYATNAGIYSRGELTRANTDGRWINHLTRCGADGVLACGEGGTLMYARRTDDDMIWREANEGLGFQNFNALAGTGDNDIWAGEWYGRILHFDGETWTREDASEASGMVTDLQVMPDGWVAANVGGNLSLRNPEGAWSSLRFLADPVQRFQALGPDSVIAITGAGTLVWSDNIWHVTAKSPNWAFGLEATASGTVFTLVPGEDGLLQRWTGSGFETVAALDSLDSGILCASRSTETVWVGVNIAHRGIKTTIHRFRNGRLEDVTAGVPLPGPVVAMSEMRPDDLFILTANQVWRFHDGHWTREPGLPEHEYLRALWSSPDGGLYVAGQPLFHKDYACD